MIAIRCLVVFMVLSILAGCQTLSSSGFKPSPVTRVSLLQTQKPHPIIFGQVVDEKGRPLENVALAAGLPGHGHPWELRASTDKNGGFRFESALAYVVRAEKRGYAPAFAEFKTLFNQQRQQAKNDSFYIVLVLRSGSVVSGRVLSEEDGSPIPNALVQAHRWSGTTDVGLNPFVIWESKRTRTDKNGFYTFENIPEGVCYISSSAIGYTGGRSADFGSGVGAIEGMDIRLSSEAK